MIFFLCAKYFFIPPSKVECGRFKKSLLFEYIALKYPFTVQSIKKLNFRNKDILFAPCSLFHATCRKFLLWEQKLNKKIMHSLYKVNRLSEQNAIIFLNGDYSKKKNVFYKYWEYTEKVLGVCVTFLFHFPDSE